MKITKERVKDILEFGAGRIISPITDDEIRELARIALASLEAEADAVCQHQWKSGGANKLQRQKQSVKCGRVELAAPPAPTVPNECPAEIRELMASYSDALFDDEDAQEIWNACRAAMLQGAEPDFREISNSSTKHFRENAETSTKCWCHTCRPVKISDMRFVVCPECGNKRCPHANDHRNACTGSNEPGQEGSAYPAAPQQEVNNDQ